MKTTFSFLIIVVLCPFIAYADDDQTFHLATGTSYQFFEAGDVSDTGATFRASTSSLNLDASGRYSVGPWSIAVYGSMPILRQKPGDYIVSFGSRESWHVNEHFFVRLTEDGHLVSATINDKYESSRQNWWELASQVVTGLEPVSWISVGGGVRHKYYNPIVGLLQDVEEEGEAEEWQYLRLYNEKLTAQELGGVFLLSSRGEVGRFFWDGEGQVALSYNFINDKGGSEAYIVHGGTTHAVWSHIALGWHTASRWKIFLELGQNYYSFRAASSGLPPEYWHPNKATTLVVTNPQLTVQRLIEYVQLALALDF